MPASAWASTSVRFFGAAGAPVGRSDYATSCSATGQFWVWCCASFCALLRKAYRTTAPVRPGGQGGAAHWRSGFHPPVRLQPERACALSCVRGQWGVLGSDALRLDYPGAAIGGRPVTLHGRHPARHGERQQWVDLRRRSTGRAVVRLDSTASVGFLARARSGSPGAPPTQSSGYWNRVCWFEKATRCCW
jgi:hypothetical protein